MDMELNLKILMLEDLEDDVGLIERELKKAKMHFTLRRVDTRDEFVEALDSFHPDVILSDHAMPQFNSIEALNYCRSKGVVVPFVLVTGTVSEEFAVNCLKQGVDDYILKTNLSRLPSAITSALRQREMEQQKIEAEKSLKEQNEQLLKINTELDSFVYSVSHNLRGPLASILGLVNLTRMEDIGFDHQNYFDLIEKRIMNLDHTIRQILDHYKNARMVLFPNHC
ncbi:MAG: response regulator [Bacteroidia bacterium]|nr:response regulator [Bacteroidia bacterium]